MHEDVKVFFESHLKSSASHNNVHYTESSDKGHGHVEHRQAWVTQAIDWLKQRNPDCSGLQSIGMVELRRDRDDESSVQRRFYISSCAADAATFLPRVREHWHIENKLHWVLDVSFNEDQCRVRQGRAAQNPAVVRHIAMNLLKQESSKLSMKAKRCKAGWDHRYLCQVLSANQF